MLSLLKGPLALIIRCLLLIAGGAMASAGWVTQTGISHFCFDAATVANGAASAIAMMGGGGVSIAAGVGWRWWAKRRGGVT